MKPRLFFASSNEGFSIAEELKKLLSSKFDCVLWKDGIFRLSDSTLESLYRAAISFDFGVFVFSPDDLAKIRKKESKVARDNVIFELGLFMGALGPKRGFFVIPEGEKNFHIPTDLAGINYARYDSRLFLTSPAKALEEAEKTIIHSIQNHPEFFRQLDLNIFPSERCDFKRALIFNFKNKTSSPVVVSLDGFIPSERLPLFPWAHKNIFSNTCELKWLVFKGETGQAIYGPLAYLFEVNSNNETFLPLDDAKLSIEAVFELIQARSLGKLKYTCTWLEPFPLIKRFEIDL